MSKSGDVCLASWFASVSHPASSAAASLVRVAFELGSCFRHRLGITQLAELAGRRIFSSRTGKLPPEGLAKSRGPGGHKHVAAEKTRGFSYASGLASCLHLRRYSNVIRD